MTGVPDVVVVVSDGLGNQLFQLAASLTVLEAVAGSTLEVVAVDERPGTPMLKAMTGVGVRRPDRRQRRSRVTLAALPGPLSPLMALSATHRARREGRLALRPSSPFDPAPSLAPGQRVEMRGHFQHPSWFERSWGRVADLLVERAPGWYPDRVAERRAVLHVRRGDYVGHGWQLPADYYRRAVECLGVVDEEVVVVTDEPDFVPWIEAVLRPYGCSVSNPAPSSSDGGAADFWTMAAADRIVTSNSTFAWWAAACGTRRPSPAAVVCPDPWMRWPHLPAPSGAFPLEGWTLADSGFAHASPTPVDGTDRMGRE